VRAELLEADRLLGQSLNGVGTVAVVLDPGRRQRGGEGRVVLWREKGCTPAAAARHPNVVEPGAVASGLLRALGLPQSRELPPPPLSVAAGAAGMGCRWPEPPVVVDGYGEPHRPAPPRSEGGEYLENLRSLGYL
jgi:hypothetical protein